jgi:hypothetical protein
MAGRCGMISSSDFLNNLLNRLLPNCAAPVLAKVLKPHEGPGKNKYSVDVQVLKAGSLEETDQIISEVPISPLWATKKKRGVYAMPHEGQVVIIEFLEWNLAYPYVSGIYSNEYDADEFCHERFIVTDGDGMYIEINSKEKYILVDTGKDSSLKLEKKKITAKIDKSTIVMSEDEYILVDTGKDSSLKLEEKKITFKTDKSTLSLREDKFSEKNNTQSMYLILKDLMQMLHDVTTVGPPPRHKISPPCKMLLKRIMGRLDALMEA